MLEQISINLDLSDQAFKSSLLPLIEEASMLNLSVEGIPYPEEIIVTDNIEYSPKTGEIIIGVGCEHPSSHANIAPKHQEVVNTLKKTVCYWETARMNRTSGNSMTSYSGVLEELASKILRSAQDKKLSAAICKSIVKDMPIALVVIDSKGSIVMLNEKAKDFFKGSDVNPQGKLAEIALPGDFNELLTDKVQDPHEAIVNGSMITLKKFTVPVGNNNSVTILLFY